VTISNSTFSGNRASFAGGGIFNYLGNVPLTMTISNSTFSGNSASTSGGGIQSFGEVKLENTIIANSTSGGNCSGAIFDGGYNLDSANTCGFTDNAMINTDPMLGGLMLNSPGSTATHALLPNSPAINAASAANCPATDQRGVSRPKGAGCDIGAYEIEFFTLTVAGAGTGVGSVTATNVNCSINVGVTSNDCTDSVPHGSNIVLTATAGANSQFASWINCDSPSGNQCTMTMNADKTVTATFNLVNRTLTVAGAGTGAGTVTATNVNCSINVGVTSNDCTDSVPHGSNIVLTATAGANSAFTSWTNCDSPSGNQCTMTMNADKTVTATFNLTPTNLTATKEDSDPNGSPYNPGDTINYTVVLTNSGGQAQANNSTDEFSDTITSVATLNATGTASSGTLTINASIKKVTWNGSIPAGEASRLPSA
jgi:predicted outer membrane repeat protein